jgi:hypothetical protein
MPLQLVVDNDALIRISRTNTFKSYKWKEAILYYLHGIWGDRWSVVRQPQICFPPGLTLCLDYETCSYTVSGHAGTEFISHSPNQTQSISNKMYDVQVGLASFVECDRLQVLKIAFPDGNELRLGKRSRDEEIYCWFGECPKI